MSTTTQANTPKTKIAPDKVIGAVLEIAMTHSTAIAETYFPNNVFPAKYAVLASELQRMLRNITLLEVDNSIGLTYSELVDAVKEHKDFDEDDFTKFVEYEQGEEPKISDFGEYELRDELVSNGYAVIKIDNIQQQAALEAFVSTTIWPLFSDRCNWEI